MLIDLELPSSGPQWRTRAASSNSDRLKTTSRTSSLTLEPMGWSYGKAEDKMP